MKMKSYQYGIIGCTKIQVEGSNTNCEKNVDENLEPIIPNISTHINK